MKRALGLLTLCAVASVATGSPAQSASEYVVVEGDDCEVVAQKVYGDKKLITLLHDANPQLGPTPHKLKAGQVLRTPKPGSEAKVTFIRKDVESATPEIHPAKVNEDLSRGHKVSTLSESSAEVTFKDTTRLQLGEHTLVVILGGTSGQSSQKQATASETTLMKGELRAHLGALAGKTKPIATPGASIAVGGESKVSVDPKSTTRLAVYQGKSSLSASGGKVDVKEGFGSKADLGKKPTPPRPLPKAPTWSAPLPRTILTFADADVSGTYATTETIDKFHVQLARDAAFNDLVVDARLPSTITKLEARGVAAGTYFARVSAIDADLFEGAFSEVASLRVVKVTPTVGTLGSVDVGTGMFCGLDGAQLAPVIAPIALPPGKPHTLRCALDEKGEGAAELALDAKYAGAAPSAPTNADEPAYSPINGPHAPARVRPLGLGLWFGGHDARKRLGIGSTLALEATYNVPLGYFAFSIGARPFWERYGIEGDRSGHTADVFGVGLPIGLRLRRNGLTPFLAVTPQLLHDRVRANIGVTAEEALRERIQSRTSFALQLGGGLRLAGDGRFGAQLEVGYRLASTHSIANGDVALGGIYAALGGHFAF